MSGILGLCIRLTVRSPRFTANQLRLWQRILQGSMHVEEAAYILLSERIKPTVWAYKKTMRRKMHSLFVCPDIFYSSSRNTRDFSHGIRAQPGCKNAGAFLK